LLGDPFKVSARERERERDVEKNNNPRGKRLFVFGRTRLRWESKKVKLSP
jgi:hypothetical protein